MAGTKAEDALAAEGGQTTLLVAGSAAIAAVVAVSAGLVGTSLGTSSEPLRCCDCVAASAAVLGVTGSCVLPSCKPSSSLSQ